MPLTLKGKFQAFIILQISYPSPGNWASNIRLVTKVLVSNIVFRTDQHSAGAIRTTRNWKKIIKREAFTTDLTHCLQNILFSLKQRSFQYSPSPCIYESALIEKTKDWVSCLCHHENKADWTRGTGRMQLLTNCLSFILPGLFLSRKSWHSQNTTLATCQLNTTLGFLACGLVEKSIR